MQPIKSFANAVYGCLSTQQPEEENVPSGDEEIIWADKTELKQKEERAARAMGLYYGIIDKAARGKNYLPPSKNAKNKNHR